MDEEIGAWICAILIVVLIVGILGYGFYKEQQKQEAIEKMIKAKYDITMTYCESIGYNAHLWYTQCINCHDNIVGERVCDPYGPKIPLAKIE